LNRLDVKLADAVVAKMQPLVDLAAAYMDREMEAGRLRRADSRLVLAFAYSTVVGIASEPVLLRAVGWEPSVQALRTLRRELLGYLRAALAP
jgi:hypothetical protein